MFCGSLDKDCCLNSQVKMFSDIYKCILCLVTLILAMKELIKKIRNELKACCCFFLFSEGSIAAAKRCDQIVQEWNLNFVNFLGRQKLIQKIRFPWWLWWNKFNWNDLFIRVIGMHRVQEIRILLFWKVVFLCHGSVFVLNEDRAVNNLTMP